MGVFYEFEHLDVFTAGTVGPPGSRVFYLQARHGGQRISVKCEKQQVAAIANYLRKVLNDLPPVDDRPLDGTLELATPVDEVFVLGPIGLGYDRAADRLIVQLEELDPTSLGDDVDTPVDDAPDGHVRLFVSRGQAAAFCEHADRVIEAGRPDCQWCSNPVDPDGHPCPRMN